MSTKELIKAEIDKMDADDLEELYGLVKRFTDSGRLQKQGRRVVVYVGSPRLLYQDQALDFEKEVSEAG